MQKRQSTFEKEKQELAKNLELKNLQLREIERTKLREIESVRSERDFNKREMDQAFEMVDKLKRKLAGSGTVPDGNGDVSTQNQVGAKRLAVGCSQSVPKKPKYSPNIDE